MPSKTQIICSACTLARAVSPVAPSALGVQSIATVGAAPTKARMTVSSIGFLLPSAATVGTSVAAIIGRMFTFTPDCGMRTFQRLTAACGAWKETLFWPGERVIARAYSSTSSICSGCLPLCSISRRWSSFAPPRMRAGSPLIVARTIAASASRRGTSCQPSLNRSIFKWAVTCTTSLDTVASFSISVMTAPTGGRGAAAGWVLSWAAFQSSSNFS